jgi:hypothetical protein
MKIANVIQPKSLYEQDAATDTTNPIDKFSNKVHLPEITVASIAGFFLLPSTMKIVKKVLWRAIPGLGAVLQTGTTWDLATQGKWSDAFLSAGLTALNIGQVFGYALGGAPGAAATLAEISGQLYLYRIPLIKAYYEYAEDMDVSQVPDEELEAAASTLIGLMAEKLAKDVGEGILDAIGMGSDVEDEATTDTVAPTDSTKNTTRSGAAAPSTPTNTPAVKPQTVAPTTTTPAVKPQPVTATTAAPTSVAAKPTPTKMVPPDYDNLSFRKAFASARALAKKIDPENPGAFSFTWKGKPYQTNIKGERFIPTSKQRQLLIPQSATELSEAVGADTALSIWGKISKLFKGADEAGDVAGTAAKGADEVGDAAVSGSKALPTEHIIDDVKYTYDAASGKWLDPTHLAVGGKGFAQVPEASLAGRELYKIRSTKIDAAADAAASAGKTAGPTSSAPPKITPEVQALLRKKPPESWTVAELTSLGLKLEDVPFLSAARSVGLDIAATADEIVKAPWYRSWSKLVHVTKFVSNNLLMFALLSALPVADALVKQRQLDKNDPNYQRRLTEIWAECIAKIGAEATAAILGAAIARKLVGTVTANNKAKWVAGLVGWFAGLTAEQIYIDPHIESIVQKASNFITGTTIPRGQVIDPATGKPQTNADGTPVNYGDVTNNPLYKKAYNWAVKSGYTGSGPARFAMMIYKQGPNGPLVNQLNETILVGWLYKQLQESNNARRTINIHNSIKSILAERSNADAIERVAFSLLESGIFNEDANNDNFMTNVTAAIAANTKGDKVGAQKALDAAKLNNPATGTDQANQQKMLDQLAKANPSLAVPNTNPNSTQNQPTNPNATQTNMEEAGGIGGGVSGGTIQGQQVGANSAEIIQAYNEFAAQYPAAKFLLDILPVTGTATSIIDASQDLRNGKYGEAAINILGAIPGFKIGKYLTRGLQNTVHAVNKGAQAVNLGNAASNYNSNTAGSATSNTAPQPDMVAPILESPKMGDHVMLELADGRVIVAPISELRGNSMIVTLDETGHQWLDESPSHDALKIGDGTQSISSTAQFWNTMVDSLTSDTPMGWAQLFVNLQDTTGHVARTMPHQWANIWRQQHIALGDELTRGDMTTWVKEVESAIDNSGLTESSLDPAGSSELCNMLDSKDAAMLAVWMTSHAGSKGISVAKFAKDTAVQSGLPANHWWGKIKNLVNENADPYSMEKRYYIVRKTSSAAPADGISGFHRKSEADKKLATMKNPDQYMVRAIDSTKLPKDEMTESRRSSDINFSPEDIAVIADMTDLEDAKKHAIRLITRNSRRPMTVDKIRWFKHHINNSKSVRALTKMMYDMLLSGEGLSVIGTVSGMNPNSYQQTFKEAYGNDYLNSIIESNQQEFDKFITTGEIDSTGDLYNELYEYFANDMDPDLRQDYDAQFDYIIGKLCELKYARMLNAPKTVVVRGILDDYRNNKFDSENLRNIVTMFRQAGHDWPELDVMAQSASSGDKLKENDEDEEQLYKEDALSYMLGLYDALNRRNIPLVISMLAELGELYQEKGVYLTHVEDDAYYEARKLQRISGLLEHNRSYIINGLLELIKQRGETHSIANIISVLDYYGIDWTELELMDLLDAPSKNDAIRSLLAAYKDGTDPGNINNIIDIFKQFGYNWPELDVIKQSASNGLDEAEYKGKTVPLSKPIRTSPSEGGKFKVYVKDPKTGNIKMVRFGDTTGLSIKRDDPKRRKNYRARHHCENPGPKTKANYWSCKMWTAKPVGKILKGK